MAMDSIQTSVLRRFRKQKARFGSVALTLFLAGWLNLLVQPCLVAASFDSDLEFGSHRLAALSSGGAAISPELSVDDHSLSADCESMEGCGDWEGSYPVAPSLELETKFLTVVVSSAQIQPEPVPAYPQLIGQSAPSARVPLFIQNCAFLI